MSPNDPSRLRRFRRLAAWVRLSMRPLARMTYEPDTFPDLETPMVLVANHRSLFDVFVAVEALDRYGCPARCLVRRRYMDQPVVGHALRAVDCIPAGDGSGEAIGEAVETLEAGRSVAVMAEGRVNPPEARQPDGLGELRPGFVAIARKVDARILPIGITGSDLVWPRDRWPRFRPWRRPAVDIRLGPPIEIGEASDEEVMDVTRAAISSLLTERG